MFCFKCGTQVLDGALFCANCGEKLSVNTEIVVAPRQELETEKHTTEEIKEFLRHAKTLEVSKHTLRETRARLQVMIEKLGVGRRINKPMSEASEGFDFFWWFFGIFFLAGLVFCVLLSGDPEASDRVIANIISIVTVVLLFFNSELLKSVGIALGIAAGASLVLCIIVTICKYMSYRSAVKKYHKEIEADQRRVQLELRQAEALKRQQDAINADILDVDAALERLYSLDVIKPKYRELIPVVTILEYLEYERCCGLVGATGAYNLYEQESRQDKIISQLDQVISLLERIEENQYALYNAIKESNYYLNQMCQQASDMIASSKVIEQNTAITAYHAKVAAENSAISAYIDFCRM